MENFQEFVSVQIDSVYKKYEKDEYEYQQEAFDEFYAKVEEYVAKNCDGMSVVFAEYDPDYDKYEEVFHDTLMLIKGHKLVDYITTDLIGVEICVILIQKD